MPLEQNAEMERLKNDPFIVYWNNNYVENYNNRVFSEERTRPLIFLANTFAYSSLPVILVGAGPSLDNNISVLKNYKDNCLIVCADIVLFKLTENGIIPDFVVNIDPHEELIASWRGVDTSNLIFVCPTTTNPKTIDTWKGRIFFFNQTDIKGTPKGEALKKIIEATHGFGSIENCYFVGATMLQFSKLLNPKVCILMGYDFSYSDARIYCNGVMERKSAYQLNYPEDQRLIDTHTIELTELQLKKKNLEISANGKVYGTTRLYEMYKNVFVSLIKKYKLNVINSTEGGILTEIPVLPAKESFEKWCSSPIQRKDVFILPKRKRNRK